MGVTSYTDISYRAGGRFSQDGSKSDSTLTYQVILDDYNTSLGAIVTALGMELYVTVNPYNAAERLTGAEIEFYPEHRLIRNVVLKFSNSIDVNEQNNQQNPNPLDRPLKISGRRQQYKKILTKDIHGDPLKNSAGDVFEGINKDSGRWVHVFEYNVSLIPIWARTYADTLNDSTVQFNGLSFDAETLKFVPLDYSSLLVENEQAYYKLRFELHEREEGWTHKEVDRGFNARDIASGSPTNADGTYANAHIRIPFFDDNMTRLTYNDGRRRPVTKPWPLDGNGFPIDDPSTEAHNELSFEIYETNDFKVIPGVT
jgi:hypothetical protein